MEIFYAMELLLKIVLRYKNIIIYNYWYINISILKRLKSEIMSNWLMDCIKC